MNDNKADLAQFIIEYIKSHPENIPPYCLLVASNGTNGTDNGSHVDNHEEADTRIIYHCLLL